MLPFGLCVGGDPLPHQIGPVAHDPSIGKITLPATIDLAGAEIEMVSLVRREFRLYDALHNGFLEIKTIMPS